ncbi:UNVERIFIED_CONTAM: hypothetical protein Sradi_1585800 [Sesamum radiatum]|uniref:Uncharacterized protein n=1 Tax=Sesamum radiatum TaxID=300843 RepID=A0AAW2U908_SESRA
MAQDPKRRINKMTSLDLNQQPLCIEYSTLDVDFELKSDLIHLLPTFWGLAGLSEINRSLVDAASGGALYDKAPTEARKLIKIMAFNTQQFGSRNDNPPRKVSEVSVSINERLDEFTPLVKKFVVGGSQQVKTCGICTSLEHFTDACPTLHEEPTKHANAVGGFSGPSQRGHDFSNTYNPGWRDHPNLRYRNQPQNFQRPPYQPPPPPPPPQSNSNSGTSLEDMMKHSLLIPNNFNRILELAFRTWRTKLGQAFKTWRIKPVRAFKIWSRK